MSGAVLERGHIPAAVKAAVAEQPVVDLHTHLYPPGFGTPVPSAAGKTDPTGLMLWGIDELVTYHYLVAEVFRVVPPSRLPYEQFWKMTRPQQADHIWKQLFVERSPLSEACRGVLTTLHRLGLDPNVKDLTSIRSFFCAAGSRPLHRSRDGPGRHRADYHDQCRLRRQRTATLAERRPCPGPTLPRRAADRSDAARLADRRSPTVRVGLPGCPGDYQFHRGRGATLPGRVDRSHRGRLPGRQPAAGVSLPGRRRHPGSSRPGCSGTDRSSHLRRAGGPWP